MISCSDLDVSLCIYSLLPSQISSVLIDSHLIDSHTTSLIGSNFISLIDLFMISSTGHSLYWLTHISLFHWLTYFWWTHKVLYICSLFMITPHLHNHQNDSMSTANNFIVTSKNFIIIKMIPCQCQRTGRVEDILSPSGSNWPPHPLHSSLQTQK